jgi:hypothetical protein
MDFINQGVIYLITGPKPEHKYIGQTRKYRNDYVNQKMKYFDYIGRFKEHIVAAKYKPTYHIDKVIREYEPENFSVKLITYCKMDELDELEVKYILEYDTLHPNGLNIVLGNPHKNCDKERTSLLLREHYANADVKLNHSINHRSNFKDIKLDNIDKILIKPIKEDNNDKIVYMYIRYKNDIQCRRRYGGIHEDFKDAYNRCIKDANELVSIDNIIDYVKEEPLQEFNEIKIVELKVHKMKQHKLISLYITDNDVKKWNEKKRFVFGGKTLSLDEAYIKAINFIKKNKIDLDKIKINDSLMATLPNCWNLLRA